MTDAGAAAMCSPKSEGDGDPDSFVFPGLGRRGSTDRVLGGPLRCHRRHDTSFSDPAPHEHCAAANRCPVAGRRGRYRDTARGVEVRHIFHQLRSHAIENFNGQFKAIFDTQSQVPTRGLRATRRYLLGAVLVYQLTLLYRHHCGADLRVGLKPFLKAA